jgi:hypothetical protein
MVRGGSGRSIMGLTDINLSVFSPFRREILCAFLYSSGVPEPWSSKREVAYSVWSQFFKEGTLLLAALIADMGGT